MASVCQIKPSPSLTSRAGCCLIANVYIVPGKEVYVKLIAGIPALILLPKTATSSLCLAPDYGL